MTKYTNADGGTSTTPKTTHPYGPYLQSVPSNSVSGKATLRIVNAAATVFTAPGTDGGWWFNLVTGEFRADLKNTHTTTDGTKLNEL